MQINATIPNLDYNPMVRQNPENPDTAKIEKKKQELTEIKVDKTENFDKLKNVLAEHNITMKFSQDIDTKELVVELVDDKTGESIRQMPSTISLKLAALFIKTQGQFVDAQE
jgi:flagellar protein FlaG